jgi:outer membrane protein TolC
VRLTVIGAVADAYLAERWAQEQLGLTEATLADWQTSRDITRRLHGAGQASGTELAQAEGQVQQAQADLAQGQRALMQATNALVLAVGAPLPADLPAPIPLMQQPIRTAPAAGLPSDLLLRRPDIAQAEHDLRAANADIGAARAAFLPRLSLTGGLREPRAGRAVQCGQPKLDLHAGHCRAAFHGGALRGNLDLARLRTSIAVATYEKSIQGAFREVADGLPHGPPSTVRWPHSRQAPIRDRRVSLAGLSWKAGQTGRLELLDAQRSLCRAAGAADRAP